MNRIPPSPVLEIRDLRLVIALSREKSTARAARTLHLTQSAVSRALLSVESRLGKPLFERTPRGLVPTAAGEVLIARAEPLLAEFADLERQILCPPAPARLRIVCECHTAYHWLPSAVVRLRAALPDIELVLAIEHTADPVTALREGQLDVAMLTSSSVEVTDLGVCPLFEDELVFVLSPRHPLARVRALTPDDLIAHRLVSTQAPRSELRWFAREVFGLQRGQQLPRPPEVDVLPLTEAVVDLVRAGLGIGVLSEWVLSPHLHRGDLLLKRLEKGPLLRPWSLAWRPEQQENAARLRSAIAATAPGLSTLGASVLEAPSPLHRS